MIIRQRQHNKPSIPGEAKQEITLEDVERRIESLNTSEQPLVFAELLEEEAIEELLQQLEHTSRERVYTPHVTLSAFLGQAICADGSCQQAVHRVNSHRCSLGLAPASVDTASYCEARQRLPEELLWQLLQRSAATVEQREPQAWLWKERRVVLVDGCVSRAPDTPANQEAFPQPSSQAPGVGFPQVRQLVAISLSSAMVLDVQIGPARGKQTGELSLFRRMIPAFRRGDVVVADANFDSFPDIATLKQRGVDFVCAIAGSRTSAFTGACHCVEEKRVRMKRHHFDKARITRDKWASLPKYIYVRMIRYRTDTRSEEITIVTTLLDRERYPAEAIAQLYGMRWNCELDIRSIKSVMGMDQLRCKTPEMLRREIYSYLLAYNLVRAAISDAARVTDQQPRGLSFKNAMQSIVEYASLTTPSPRTMATLLWSIANNQIGNRPGRKEPRKIKHRKNKYEKMTRPRNKEKAALNT